MKKHFLLFPIYLCLAGAALILTPSSQALLHDANTYYQIARTGNYSNFIDPGYSVVLALCMKVIGSSNLVALQIMNYLFWIASSYLIYLSAIHAHAKSPKFTSYLMLFSPLFLSFSAKLYSEPFAALGVSLLIYGLTVSGLLPILFGTIILGSTKSLFVPGLVVLILYYLARREQKRFLPLLVGVVLLIPVFLSSLGGGRSLYNLAVERAKLDQSYDEILACAPYYLSYPLGQKLLPQYEGVCHQNDPSPYMSGYEHNPYVNAVTIRGNGFAYHDWWVAILADPVKYFTIFLVGLFNLVLFEGVYPSILLQLPSWVIPIVFIITKLLLVSYLWVKVWQVVRANWYYSIPIIYLLVMIGNFQVEPRYIYPLIPYIYFLSGLDHNKHHKI